jgi:hypothetical protein
MISIGMIMSRGNRKKMWWKDVGKDAGEELKLLPLITNDF